jgi:hypothetical protein
LPAPLTAALGQQLLLQPLYSLIGSPAAAQELLLEVASVAAAEAAAVSSVNSTEAVARQPYSAELALLHELGWQLGVAAWQEDWRGRCREISAGGAAAAAAAGGGAAGAAGRAVSAAFVQQTKLQLYT